MMYMSKFTYARSKILRILTACILYVNTVNEYVTQLQYFKIICNQFNVGSFRVVRVKARSKCF